MFRRPAILIVSAITFCGLTSAYVLTPDATPVGAAVPELPPVAVTSTTVAAPIAATTAPAKVTPVPSTAQPKPPADESMVKAQQRLDALGYWNGKADGKAGASTAQALMAFQKVNGLPRTGKLDTVTKPALATANRPEAPQSADGMVIDKSLQVIFVVRDGTTKYIFNTSTGNEKNFTSSGRRSVAHTPTGDFSVIRQVNRVDPGPLGSLYRPKYLTTDGIAVHGAADIPAYPASHGCARVSNAVMDLIWSQDLMAMGSPVAIVD